MNPHVGKRNARLIFDSALAAVQPAALVADFLVRDPLRQNLHAANRIIVVGAGKACAGMVVGLETVLANRISKVVGLVNVPNDLARTGSAVQIRCARPRGLNEPTPAAAEGVELMLKLVSSARGDDCIIVLLSGGGSSLLPAPANSVSLADKITVFQLLSECGATIAEINCVRKHLSRIKGGGLAGMARCTLHALIISDVVGDPLDVIASGPTAVDPTTFADALSVLSRHRMTDRTPKAVLDYLTRGLAGLVPETLKQLPSNVHNHVIGNNALALSAAIIEATRLGYLVHSRGDRITGEAADVARTFAAQVRTLGLGRHCILGGGETTVTLSADHGLGGRNQEFALALLGELGPDEMHGVTILSAGTDGEDGPTDAAGVLADASVFRKASAAGVDRVGHLKRHDAYSFFSATDDLLITGLTGTNVMDIYCVLIDR